MIPIHRVLPIVLTLAQIIFVTIYILSVSHPSKATTELCNPNRSTTVYKFTYENCPFGVLFAMPMISECLKSASDNDQSNFYSDICENVKYDPDSSKTIQLIGTITETDLSEEDSCKGTGPNQCDVEMKTVGKADISEPGDDLSMAMEMNYDEPDEVSARRNDTNVLEQTFRLFKFMVGLEDDKVYVERKKRDAKDSSEDSTKKSTKSSKTHDNSKEKVKASGETGDKAVLDPEDEENYDHEGPNLRVIDLLKLTFKILNKHCDNAYVSKRFVRDVQRMFMFLLLESDTSQMQDVSLEEYGMVSKALNECLGRERAFALNGTSCRNFSRVKLIEKNGQTSAYKENAFAYKPSLYDIPIDATWGAVDFVHGLCYGTFPDHVNNHHLYQQSVDRVFNDEMVYRWNHPPELYRPEIWDHMLSANVRSTMKNLDVCIHAAYYDTPFIHRLERPLEHFDGPRSVLVTKPPFVALLPIASSNTPAPVDSSATAATADPNASEAPVDPDATEAPADPDATEAPADPNASEAPADPSATEVPAEPGATEAPGEDPSATEAPADSSATDAAAEPSATEAPVEEAVAEGATDPSEAVPGPEPDAAAADESTTPAAAEAVAEAPLNELSTADPAKKRRKRSNPLTLDEFGLSEAGWCFQTEEQQKKVLKKYIEANCPDSKMLKESNDKKKNKKGGSTESPGDSEGKNSGSGESKKSTKHSGSGESEKSSKHSGSGESEKSSKHSGSGESEKSSKHSGSGESEKSSITSGSDESEKPVKSSGSGESEKQTKNSGSVETEKPSKTSGSDESEKPSKNSGSGESEKQTKNSGSSESEKPAKNSGSGETAAKNSGSGETAAQNSGSGETAAKNSGSGETAAKNSGSGETAAKNSGSGESEKSSVESSDTGTKASSAESTEAETPVSEPNTPSGSDAETEAPESEPETEER